MQILPSYRASAGQAGLELAPFRGVRYAPELVSGLAQVTSPPYDVIYRGKQDQLMAEDPHNVVRLILPQPDPGRPGEEYRDAALLLRRWLEERVLVADPEPALYVYEQGPAGGQDGDGADHDPAGPGDRTGSALNGVQRGLIGALRLADPADRVVLPHEDVSPGPVAGRLSLMEATQANLEPIFLLYDGSPAGRAEAGAAGRVIAAAVARQPLVDARTNDGLRHRLWAITSPADLAAIAADLAPRQALIADGHHRYAAYRQLQRRRHEAGQGPGPWDYGLALLVDSASYPPHIGAIHRVVPGLEVRRAAKLAATAFTVRALPGGSADVRAAVAELDHESAHGPAFVLAGAERAYLISRPDPEQVEAAMPEQASAPWRALPAAILQELLITRVWGLTDDECSVRVVHHDAGAAVAVAREAGGTAVLCSAMSPGDVYAVASRGERVPRKSTSFAPKPRTGLVLRTFAHG